MRRMATLGLLLALAGPALADEDPRERLADKVRVTPAQAERVAFEVERGRVHEIELKARNGRPLYRVRFENGGRVWVDAVSGRVVRREPPSPRDDQ